MPEDVYGIIKSNAIKEDRSFAKQMLNYVRKGMLVNPEIKLGHTAESPFTGPNAPINIPEDVSIFILPREVESMLQDSSITDGDRDLTLPEFNMLKSNGLKWLPKASGKKGNLSKYSSITKRYYIIKEF